MYDIVEQSVVNALTPLTIGSNTTTVGEIIDKLGADSKIYEAIMFAILTQTITDGAYDIQLFEGDASNMSDETQVTDVNDIITPDGTGVLSDIALADDDTVFKFGYVGSKRYTRIKLVSTAVTTGGLFSGVAVQGHVRHRT